MKTISLSLVLVFFLDSSVLIAGNIIRRVDYIEEQCDLMELNHFYDKMGCHVFSQVIFWEKCPSSGKFYVREYALVEMRESLNRIPINDVITDMWVCDWLDTDRKVLRKIKSKLYRESWTQTDPERENKKILPEKFRLRLASPRTQEPHVKECLRLLDCIDEK